MTKRNLTLKQDRFKNVAARRVQKVLESIESLSKCANKNNYEYTDADIAKMIKVIKDQVKMLELSFSEKNKNKVKTFEF